MHETLRLRRGDASPDAVCRGGTGVVERGLGFAKTFAGEGLHATLAATEGAVQIASATTEAAALSAVHALVELIDRVADEGVHGQLDQTKHNNLRVNPLNKRRSKGRAARVESRAHARSTVGETCGIAGRVQRRRQGGAACAHQRA